MSDEQLVRAITKLTEKVDALGQTGGRYGGSVNRTKPPEGADSGVASNIDSLLKVLGGGLKGSIEIAGNLAGKAMDNTATVQDATQAVTGVIRSIGPIGDLLGKGMEGVVDVLVQSVDNWQKFSGAGLQFGGNALALNEAVKKTGLNFSDYSELIEKATPGFANFGEGLSRGAEQFGEASQQLQMKYGKELNMLGLTTKDVNNALALVVRGAGMIDAKNEQQMSSLLASAAQLAKEMDAMAKLTGTSRKEQEKNIETMQNDVRVRARIIDLRRSDPSGNIERSIDSTMKAGSALGQASQGALLESIAGRGIMSSEKASELQEVYGVKYVNMIKEIGRLTSSQNAEDRKRAEEMTKQLYMEQIEGRKLGAKMVATTDKITGAMTEAYGAENGSVRKVDVLEANIQKYIDAGMNKTEAYDKAYADAVALGAGKATGQIKDKNGNVIAEPGDKDPRTAMTEIVTGANTQIKLFGGAISSLVNELNTTVTTQRKKNGEFLLQEAVDFVGGKTKGQDGRESNAVKDMEISGKKFIYNTANPTANPDYLTDLNKKKAAEVKSKTNSPDLKNVVPAGQTDTSRAPNINGVLKNVNTKVSDGSTETKTKVEEKQESAEPDQDPMLEKLDKISTIMERVEQNTANTARHSSTTASNTKDSSPYV